MQTSEWVTATLVALAKDSSLAARMKDDVGSAFAELGFAPRYGLPDATGLGLRRLAAGRDDQRLQMAPTDGSQCTQAGCYTRERGCSSQVACSRTGPC